MKSRFLSLLLLLLIAIPCMAQAQDDPDAAYIRENYTKIERQIPVRDGAQLFTSIYMPKDTSRPYPIMLQRTPYSVRPYGEAYKTRIGPSMLFAREGYIFVYQDVRGKMMSEGVFEAVRPHNPNKKSETDIDESTDTYDTVAWLLEHIPNNTGRVGVWGISAPGFYATHTIIDAHPAIKVVSPQAPVTDWWMGDDRHHNGAFQLQATFSFLSSYGRPRPEPTTQGLGGFRAYGSPDGYRWYMDLGPLSEVNKKYFNGENKIWEDMVNHPNYDAFWQARTPLPHLKNVQPAVLVVGGLFDAQDLYGPLKTYAAIEKNNPNAVNHLVMGPWWHGGWSRSDGDRYQDIYFEKKTAAYYREKIEFPFFNHYLKDTPKADLPEASIFLTGSNQWQAFDQWPPADATPKSLYLHPAGGLSFDAPTATDAYEEYISDPAKPVPHTSKIVINRDDRYVIQDQRFASTRTDVLVFESEVLTEDLTLAGDLFANLYVTTTGTDADFIVKLIDILPDTTSYVGPNPMNVKMGGFQFMVRGEVMRARYRNSFEHPEPMTPGELTEVVFDMEDVAHTFKAGHKMMVHIQSTWFPMVDRNPQTFVDMYKAKAEDYQKATHRVYFSKDAPSHLKMKVLE
jgi:putative CocE/NonD family hydrolase